MSAPSPSSNAVHDWKPGSRATRPTAWISRSSSRFRSSDELAKIREGTRAASIEGLMLKRLDSAYVPGRPKGLWWKWKRDPLTIDAV